jgi:N,N'-diacetyllegionaminate synthase
MRTANKLIIIAEIGINHNGSLKIAKKLVEHAKACGADYVKIQNYIPSMIVTKSNPKAKYQYDSSKNKEKMISMLAKYHFDFKKTIELMKFCKKIKIKFLSSPFDELSFNFLKKNRQKLIKIPSGEITNFPLLKLIAKYNNKIILSTGMSYLNEVKRTIKFMIKSGLNNKNISVLHCTSQYPTKPKDVNLSAMLTLKKKLNLDVGLSDHTLGFESSICAVYMGATIIEKHLTLSKKMKGPDHKTSLEPDEFRKFVTSLRNTKFISGSSKKQPTRNEKKLAKLVRKRIVAKKNIKKNEVFNINNITVKRSNKGIDASNYFRMINKKAKKNYKIDQAI